ncbi:MAG: hypothetical protein UE295_05015 [Acutalibacteraceae bacterium]|nr:hypothetical protein [Acutalibacteraceae bacterium]
MSTFNNIVEEREKELSRINDNRSSYDTEARMSVIGLTNVKKCIERGFDYKDASESMYVHSSWDIDNWTQEAYNKFVALIAKSKGKCNSPFALKLFEMGVPDDLIIKVCKSLPNHPYKAVRRSKQYKKHRGKKTQYKVRKAPFLDNLLRKHFGDDVVDSIKMGFSSASYGTSASYGMTYNLKEALSKTDLGAYDKGYSGEALSDLKQPLMALSYFLKFDETKRQKILHNEFAKQVLLAHYYENNVPRDLTAFDRKAFVKKQAQDLFDELYSMANTEGVFPEGKLEKPYEYHTLSQVGYHRNLLKNAAALAKYTSAMVALNAMGLGLYHYSEHHGVANPQKSFSKGYMRMLAKCSSVYKQYSSLIRKGTPPEAARATAQQMLEFWLKDGSVTDGKWLVYRRSDWQAPEVEQPKKQRKTSGNKGSKAKKTYTTMAELKALLEDANNKESENE